MCQRSHPGESGPTPATSPGSDMEEDISPAEEKDSFVSSFCPL